VSVEGALISPIVVHWSVSDMRWNRILASVFRLRCGSGTAIGTAHESKASPPTPTSAGFKCR